MYINFDSESQKIIDKIGHDMPVFWKDEYSGVGITTSCYELLVGLCNLNEMLAGAEFATMEDFFNSTKYSYIELPPEFNNEFFQEGWCYQCFECQNGPSVSIDVTSGIEDGNRIIFLYNFGIHYCSGCYDCIGCDRP